MKRRSNLDICVNVLEAAMKGVNKTGVVYRSNLNFEIVKKYLTSLIDGGLLRIGEDGRYRTTEKGIDFINRYKDLIEPLNVETVDVRTHGTTT